MLSKAVTLASLVALSSQALLYDHAKSDVSIYSKLNFEKQVSKNREKGISVVHFYKSGGK